MWVWIPQHIINTYSRMILEFKDELNRNGVKVTNESILNKMLDVSTLIVATLRLYTKEYNRCEHAKMQSKNGLIYCKRCAEAFVRDYDETLMTVMSLFDPELARSINTGVNANKRNGIIDLDLIYSIILDSIVNREGEVTDSDDSSNNSNNNDNGDEAIDSSSSSVDDIYAQVSKSKQTNK